MSCKEFQGRFQAGDAHTPAMELSEAEQMHLESCDSCRQMVELDTVLEQTIRAGLKQVEVPEQLQSRLQQNLGAARPRKGVSFLRVSIPVAAVAAMLLIFLFPHGASFTSMDEIGQLAIVDHESHLGQSCSKGLPEDLAVWGKEHIGMAISRPTLPPGSKLISVSKCTLGDCDTAHLRFSRDGKIFSVFIFPEKEAGFSLADNRNYTLDFSRHKVIIWKSNHQVFALVS